jgi:hypothetical protein
MSSTKAQIRRKIEPRWGVPRKHIPQGLKARMHLPATFAVYRPETATFQILQPDVASDGSYLRLKNWSVPDNLDWKSATHEERAQMLQWFRGQEWYVLPTNKFQTDETPRIHTIVVHGKTYSWWSTHHKLVWSNSMTYTKREVNPAAAIAWENSPSILVIELSTRLIMPRTDTSTYAKWCDTSAESLIAEKERGLEEFQSLSVPEERDDTSLLRIRTPPSHHYDTSDTDTEELIQRAPRRGSRQAEGRGNDAQRFSQAFVSATMFVLTFVLCAGVIALYGLVAALTLGL